MTRKQPQSIGVQTAKAADERSANEFGYSKGTAVSSLASRVAEPSWTQLAILHDLPERRPAGPSACPLEAATFLPDALANDLALELGERRATDLFEVRLSLFQKRKDTFSAVLRSCSPRDFATFNFHLFLKPIARAA